MRTMSRYSDILEKHKRHRLSPFHCFVENRYVLAVGGPTNDVVVSENVACE